MFILAQFIYEPHASLLLQKSKQRMSQQQFTPWIIFKQQEHKSVEKFCTTLAPSQVKNTRAAWICVHATGIKEIAMDKDFSEKHAKKLFLMEPSQETAIKIAKENNVLVGKWLVFCTAETVDATFATIALQVYSNELGACSCKVSTNNHGNSFVICVYVANSFDEKQVMKVKAELTKLGITTRGYKPDIFTYLNIYKNNPWKVREVLYS